MSNSSNFLLTAMVLVCAVVGNGCGVLNQGDCNCNPYSSTCGQTSFAGHTGGSWQWVPDGSQVSQAGFCSQCGHGAGGLVAGNQYLMAPQHYQQCAQVPDRQYQQQYMQPHPTQHWDQTGVQRPNPAHYPMQQPVQFPATSPNDDSGQLAPTQPTSTAPVPQEFHNLTAPEIDDAMDEFPAESRSESTEELPAPVRSEPGDQPLPTDIPEAASVPVGQDNPFPILLSPSASIEVPEVEGVIYHPMPETLTPTPAPVPQTIGGAAIVYPRTDASGPADWVQFRDTQR